MEVHEDLGITFSHKLHKCYNGLLTHNNHLRIIMCYILEYQYFVSMLMSDVMVKFQIIHWECSQCLIVQKKSFFPTSCFCPH